jgi:hypothetical protein
MRPPHLEGAQALGVDLGLAREDPERRGRVDAAIGILVADHVAPRTALDGKLLALHGIAFRPGGGSESKAYCENCLGQSHDIYPKIEATQRAQS